MKLLRALVSRRWIAATLLVLLGVAVMLRLSVWQVDRLQERRAANVALAASLAAAPLRLGVDPLPADVTELENRQVTATGTYDPDAQLLLLVQNWQGRAGVHLLTPLLLDGGETAVLVDRGWIPDAEATLAGAAQYAETGVVTVSGVAALPQTLPRARTDAAGATPAGATLQTEWYRVDVAAIDRQLPYALLPFYVVQAPDDGRTDLPFRSLPPVDLSEGSHLSYAVQWVLFALILGVGYGVYVWRELRKPSSVSRNP